MYTEGPWLFDDLQKANGFWPEDTVQEDVMHKTRYMELKALPRVEVYSSADSLQSVSVLDDKPTNATLSLSFDRHVNPVVCNLPELRYYFWDDKFVYYADIFILARAKANVLNPESVDYDFNTSNLTVVRFHSKDAGYITNMNGPFSLIRYGSIVLSYTVSTRKQKHFNVDKLKAYAQ